MQIGVRSYCTYTDPRPQPQELRGSSGIRLNMTAHSFRMDGVTNEGPGGSVYLDQKRQKLHQAADPAAGY